MLERLVRDPSLDGQPISLVTIPLATPMTQVINAARDDEDDADEGGSVATSGVEADKES